jgi:hypothetical protein
MLWHRFWLETRFRMIFVVVWSLFFFGVGLYPIATRPSATADQVMGLFLIQTTFIAFLAASMLAGSGVRTQTFGRNYRGLHGSVHFTLSLPVTRTRLLLTRTAIGFAETILVVLLVSIAAWAAVGSMRAQASVSAVIGHAFFIAIASIGIGGLAVLASTVFDDVVQTWLVTGVAIMLFIFRTQLPPWLNVIGAMTEGSPLVAGSEPWAMVAGSIAAGGLCVLAAGRVVAAQEY